ncbi:hypothetical protein BDR04DRAFT_1106862 [Suillus decipiens]|nr:hypothetical protein BDR04DRAFT_1106862 [Suillus decipiens]
MIIWSHYLWLSVCDGTRGADILPFGVYRHNDFFVPSHSRLRSHVYVLDNTLVPSLNSTTLQ